MENNPDTSPATQGLTATIAPHFPEADGTYSRIYRCYDRRVKAVTIQINLHPNFLTFVKGVAALAWFDLLRAYAIARANADRGRLRG